MIEKNNKGRDKKLTKKKLKGSKLNTVNPPKNKGNRNIIKNLLLKKFNINFLQFFLVLNFLIYSSYKNPYFYNVYDPVDGESRVPKVY